MNERVPPTESLRPRLLAFRVSHFCEKVHWALDYKGIDYEYVTLMPGLHAGRVRALTGKTHVPVLLHRGRAVHGSSKILDYLDAEFPGRPLTPRDAAAERQARDWEAYFDAELGEPARRFVYHYALDSRRFTIPLYVQEAPRWAPAFYAVTFPFVARAIRRIYKITPANVASDLERLRSVFRRVDEHLGRQTHLVGEEFSRADLTLGALASALLHPAGHPSVPPLRKYLPATLREQLLEFDRTATAEYVRTLYRDRRAPHEPVPAPTEAAAPAAAS